ncbi:hypothetical protein JNB88_17880 [Rhizobium cauense]|uniref:hypothetical protein n=1 Tax=Rhizobium cauense TaxID=1166683 RepID=UPI001C6F21A3|nr:hypothetical protein [Rhizobium cauense]MBW9115513.1 hypothetical protein [Rhizobium cauense]
MRLISVTGLVGETEGLAAAVDAAVPAIIQRELAAKWDGKEYPATDNIRPDVRARVALACGVAGLNC